MKIQSAQALKTNAHHRAAYAIQALLSHKKTSVVHKETTSAVGLKSIHNKTMSDHTQLFWADKHRARLINEREIGKLELVRTGR